jgi:raffinose synthase
MRAYQEALQGAALTRMNGNLIHCMCNGSDVAYQMFASSVWRNSQDYFPARPASIQQDHVHMNAMNNLWTSTFAIPDWDMFQSHQPEASFHAAARAISGGPIYCCDTPNKQDFALLEKLCIDGNRVLACDRPALPARDSLFVDCFREPRLLKITNHCGGVGVLGLFHCQKDGGEIAESFAPSDVPELEGKSFAAWHHNSGRVEVFQSKTRSSVRLNAWSGKS